MKRRSLVGTCVATALGLSLPANGAVGEQLQKEQSSAHGRRCPGNRRRATAPD